MVLTEDPSTRQAVLVSGGADGTLLSWNVTDHPPKPSHMAGPAIHLTAPTGTGSKAPRVRALDTHPTQYGRYLVGTDGCDVFEVKASGTCWVRVWVWVRVRVRVWVRVRVRVRVLGYVPGIVTTLRLGYSPV